LYAGDNLTIDEAPC